MSDGPGSKEKILICARDLFYFVGYQTTSVDDILKACGVAKSNFYYHFRTKDDLALAVMDLHVADFDRSAARLLSDTGNAPHVRLERFCGTLIETQAKIQRLGGCPFGNFAASLSIAEGDERADRFRQAVGAVFRDLQNRLANCLRDGIQAGTVRDDVPVEESQRWRSLQSRD